MQQTLVQICTLKEEKKNSAGEVLQLETTLTELRSQLMEPMPLQPPAGPIEALEKLEEEAQRLS
jgi:hypothetical protein